MLHFHTNLIIKRFDLIIALNIRVATSPTVLVAYEHIEEAGCSPHRGDAGDVRLHVLRAVLEESESH